MRRDARNDKLGIVRGAALLTLVAATFLMGAKGCHTVGETEDMCLQADPSWTQFKNDNGIDGFPNGHWCAYAEDCYSGVCVPDGKGDAYCAPQLALEPNSCDAMPGNNWVPLTITTCWGDALASCFPVPNPPGSLSAPQGDGKLGASCRQNADCESGICVDQNLDGYGICTIFVWDYCPPSLPRARKLDGTGPDIMYVCAP